jgi:nicotinamidase-related amidase
MNSDLGVWTSEESALVLIDYQPELLEAIRSETASDLVDLHARWLAKTAKAFDMPIVLSSVGVESGAFGPTQPALLAELPDVEPIDRSTMNAFKNQAFRDAVAATGRKRLIIGGLHTEVCLALATVEALRNGYDAMFVTDAVGGRGQVAHRTAIERLTAAGAVPSTALAVVMELFQDWAGPLSGAAQEVTGWYLAEALKLPGEVVGVAPAEMLRWNSQVAA